MTIALPNLEKLRLDLRMSRGEFAEYVGVSSETLRRWVSGRGQIPTAKLVYLANRLNTSTDYILGLTEERRPRN